MDISFSYSKIRKNYGQQPRFCEVAPYLLDSIEPNIQQQCLYCLRNPVTSSVQATEPQTEHDANTKTVSRETQGVNHAEGGWPKEIYPTDEEATTRYRRRCEREESYINAVLGLYPDFVLYINQNNGTEMYEMFFKGMPSMEPFEKGSLRVQSVFKDPDNRPIACIGWTHETDSKIALAYCRKEFSISDTVNENTLCYIWNVENPYSPTDEFLPPVACWQIVCSPVHPAIIMGGLEDGRVCIFDIRAQKEPTVLSSMFNSHRDPVAALQYMPSRLNYEFFTGSADGICNWWDIRSLCTPTDSLLISVQIPEGTKPSFANSEGICSLQYDRSLPSKFICGTETGLTIHVNRKGKSFKDTFYAINNAHKGPVRAVHRSPCTSKMFITCGDWTAHIWSEDVHSAPIISGKSHRYEIMDVIWAPLKFSAYMTVSADGKFRYWDLLRKYREPILTFPVSEYPLQKIKSHEEGKLIAVGDSKGSLVLFSLSDSLVDAGNRDKQLMTQTYDRETRREQILENRVKEIRLKLRAQEEAAEVPDIVVDEDALINDADFEYNRVVAEGMRQVGVGPTVWGVHTHEMRKR